MSEHEASSAQAGKKESVALAFRAHRVAVGNTYPSCLAQGHTESERCVSGGREYVRSLDCGAMRVSFTPPLDSAEPCDQEPG